MVAWELGCPGLTRVGYVDVQATGRGGSGTFGTPGVTIASPDRRWVLRVTAGVMDQFRNFVQPPDGVESGGVMLGLISEVETGLWLASVLMISEPCDGDERTRVSWHRKGSGHIQAQVEAHTRGLVYLGEWHTHPEVSPQPGLTDMAGWRNVTDQANAQRGRKEPTFHVIVGQAEIGAWAIT